MFNYVRSKKGATVTILVPYDCQNNCPFCINKKDYQFIHQGIYDQLHCIDEIILSIKEIDEITPECDFVISGGEPFEDLYLLDQILIAIEQCAPTHKVFINTSLPTNNFRTEEILSFLETWKGLITGLNVSRHLKPYVKECSDEIFDKIPVPVRINCVLFGDEVEGATAHIERFEERKSIAGMQFREDYTTTTLENLYPISADKCLENLLEELGLISLPKTFLLMDNIYREKIREDRFRWSYKIMDVKFGPVTFHKTMPYSSLIEGDKYYVGDIIINQRGELKSEWVEINDPRYNLWLEAYKNAEVR